MGPRTLLGTATVALAIACSARERDPAASISAAAPGARAPARAPAAAAAEPPGERRGDRHARAAARHPPQVKTAEGTIARASARLIVLRSPGGRDLVLRVGSGTAVTTGGVATGAEALREGTAVRVSYRGRDGERPTAISIEAASPQSPDVAPPPAEYEPVFTDEG